MASSAARVRSNGGGGGGGGGGGNALDDEALAAGLARAVSLAGAGEGPVEPESPPPMANGEPPPIASPILITNVYGKSTKGFAPYNPRKANQDAYVEALDPQTGSLLLLVMDGHGEFGHNVTGFLSKIFAAALFAEPAFASDVPVALREAMRKCEGALLLPTGRGGLGEQNQFSGTTLVATVVRGKHLWCANCGDSRMILAGTAAKGSPKKSCGTARLSRYRAIDVSKDHKPDDPKEKARIEANGGRVFAIEYDDGVDGPARVWLKHADIPGLAMSRSLGDLVAHTAGVSSEPEIFEVKLSPGAHCFLVSASDGLWEFMTSQEVVDIVASFALPQDAVSALMKESKRRWLDEEEVVDDTTICVACIGGWKGGHGGNAAGSGGAGSK